MAEMCSVKKNITQYQFEKTKQYQFMQNTRNFPKYPMLVYSIKNLVHFRYKQNKLRWAGKKSDENEISYTNLKTKIVSTISLKIENIESVQRIKKAKL